MAEVGSEPHGGQNQGSLLPCPRLPLQLPSPCTQRPPPTALAMAPAPAPGASKLHKAAGPFDPRALSLRLGQAPARMVVGAHV